MEGHQCKSIDDSEVKDKCIMGPSKYLAHTCKCAKDVERSEGRLDERYGKGK